ncbi:MAG: hypothetical protein ACRDOK_04545 [Streptosporangiaceae bacterium]
MNTIRVSDSVCEYCQRTDVHEPLCAVNLRFLRSMAENLDRDIARLSRRHERLAAGLADVHEAVLASPARLCPNCGKARPPTGGAFCNGYCESEWRRERQGEVIR